jgi:iron complex outermembrane receptor protein
VGQATSDLYEVRESKNFDGTFAPRPGFVDVSDSPEDWLPKKKRNNYHAFVQDEWTMAQDWELTAGVRYDHFSDFGSAVNPRGVLVWQTTPALTSKLLYGKAFRSPNFIEMYSRNNPVVIGNVDLRPQTNEVYELAFAYEVSRKLNINLSAFNYKVKDIINIVATRHRNQGDMSGTGGEIEARYKFDSSLSFLGNYSYVKTEDSRTNAEFGYYPTHMAYLREEWQFRQDWNLDTQVHHVGSRPRTKADTRDKVKSYTTVDMTVRGRKIATDWELAVSARNLFDADVREPSRANFDTGVAAIPNDLPMEGRNFFMEISRHF